MATITSANAVLTLTQAILFPTPVQIQQFAADDIYDMDQVRTVEALMGVDGVLSFGFIWVARTQNITLQANSPSNQFFDTLNAQEEATQDVYPLSGQITLPGISTKFNMINGAMTAYSPAPAAKRTLQPRRFQIMWNRVAPSPQ